MKEQIVQIFKIIFLIEAPKKKARVKTLKNTSMNNIAVICIHDFPHLSSTV